MHRLLPLSALFGLAMTGAAAAATAEVAINPVNGRCPSGFEMQKSSGSDDLCVQRVSGSTNSGNFSLASYSGDDDDDHGKAGDHDDRDDDHGGSSDDHDDDRGDHDSDSD
jgi:hypothetical protein